MDRVMVIDDPMPNSSDQARMLDWYRSVAESMSDPPRRIVVMSRVHGDDIIGRIVGDHGWQPLVLPDEPTVIG